MTRRRWALVAAVAALVMVTGALALGGGAAGVLPMTADSGASSAADTAMVEGPEPGPDGGSDAGSDGGSDGGAVADRRGLSEEGSARVPAESLRPRIISTGAVAVAAADVDRARRDLDGLLTGWRGYVADERTESDRQGRARVSHLTLRVPSERFDEAMGALGRLGRLLSTTRDSQDVTTEVIDVEARVRAQEKSLLRMEALLARAERVGEVVAVEAEVSRRQADLESLQAQQAWLADQTSYATVEVTLQRRDRPAAADDDNPFVAGLAAGWSALVGGLGGAAVVLGALLPFVPLLVLLALGLRWAARRGVLRGLRGRRPSAA